MILMNLVYSKVPYYSLGKTFKYYQLQLILMPNMIKVWPWLSAPRKYKKLSKSGYEDWLAYVPAEYYEEVYLSRWLPALDSCEDPQEFRLPNGDYVFIGGHA